MSKTIVILLIVLLATQVVADSRTMTLDVLHKGTGEPMAEVSLEIRIDNENQKGVTDEKGSYPIELPDKGCIVYANNEEDASALLKNAAHAYDRFKRVSQKITIESAGMKNEQVTGRDTTILEFYRKDDAVVWKGRFSCYDADGKPELEDYPIMDYALPDQYIKLDFFHERRGYWFAWGYLTKQEIDYHRKDKLQKLDRGGSMDGYLLGNDCKNVIELIVESPSKILHEQAELVKGVSCRVLEAKTPRGVVKAWIAPEYGYNTLKWSVVKTADDLHWDGKTMGELDWLGLKAEFEFNTIDKIDGEYIIAGGTMKHDTQFKNEDGNEWLLYYYTRTHVDLNPDFEALGAFKLDLPENTVVWGRDARADYQFINGKLVPFVDEECLGNAQPLKEECDIRELVQKVKENQGRWKNVHWICESYSALDGVDLWASEPELVNMFGPPRVTYNDIEAVKRGEEMSDNYTTRVVMMEDRGRKKIIDTVETVKEGKRQFFSRHTFAWNGERYVQYTEMAEKGRTGWIMAEPNGSLKYGHPKDRMNSTFLKYVEKAGKGPIAVTKNSDGRFRVDMAVKNETVIAYLDPEVDFNVVRWERYFDEELPRVYEGEYRKLNGVWFPHKGRTISYWRSGMRKVLSVSGFTTKEIHINDCTFTDADFEVAFAEGTSVHDMIRRVRYVQGVPGSEREMPPPTGKEGSVLDRLKKEYLPEK